MMTTSSMADLFAFLTQLMTDRAGLFEAMGNRMFRSFATILIAWFGIKSALTAASGSMTSVFHFDRFAELLLTIAFGFGMMTYYSHHCRDSVSRSTTSSLIKGCIWLISWITRSP